MFNVIGKCRLENRSKVSHFLHGQKTVSLGDWTLDTGNHFTQSICAESFLPTFSLSLLPVVLQNPALTQVSDYLLLVNTQEGNVNVP